MMLHRGDVVLAWMPFASGTGGKARPCVVIQNDRDNRRLRNVVIAGITTNLRARGEATQLLIDITTPEGHLTGLLHDSLISCNNITTLDQLLIVRVIGRLSPALMAQVDDCLKITLELL